MSRLADTAISLAAAARVAADANGTAVDVSNIDGLCQIVLNAGATEAADNTLDVKLQHSVNGTTNWNDVTGGAFAQVTNAAASVQVLVLQADSLRKFVRVVDNVEGTDPACARSVTLIGRKPY